MNIFDYTLRIAELNCSAFLKVFSGRYDAALALLAEAYSLERMVIDYVRLSRRSSSKAKRPAGESPDIT